MATRPLPTPGSDPTHKKTDPTGTAETSVKEPILQMIRSASTGPALQQHLHALMKKRWLRVAGIVIAVFLVLLTALPFLINVNSFSKSPFITAKSLEVVEVVVELALAFLAAALMPLIFSTQSNVIRIALSEPLITLLKAPNGAWKISSLSTTGVVIGKAMAHLTGGFQTLGETEVVNLRLVITGGRHNQSSRRARFQNGG